MREIDCGQGKLFSSHMEVKILRKGVNGISCAKLAPLGDCLLDVYSRIFFKSYEQKSLNFFEKS